MTRRLKNYLNPLLASLVALVAFATIVYRYTSPEQLYWDENYHIASAQKYLNGTFFMEPHPPLGKLLIALGEALLDANPDDRSFLKTDHGKSLPSNFSFLGYRLFPVVLTALAAPLFFLLLLRMTGRAEIAFIFSLALALDNAFVVHGRAAMLDGMQIFFLVGAMAGTVCIYRRLMIGAPLSYRTYLTGASLGAALATKVTSLIALPFLVILIPPMRRQLAAIVALALKILGSALVCYLLSWWVHIALGRIVEPSLPDSGFYQTSSESRAFILSGEVSSVKAFWPVFKDHLNFLPYYERGVPNLNMCNPNENGSSPSLWPIGARAINYRWDKKGDKTSYTYLVANPVVWALGLFGLLSAAALWLAALLGRCEISREWQLFAGVLLLQWGGYMAAMVDLHRVMYLYHYLVPLVFTLALAALTLPEMRLKIFGSRMQRMALAALSIVAIALGFYFYAPLTYGYPITNAELASRSLLDVWDLRCAECDLTNHLARPVCNPKEKRFPQVKIDSIFAIESYQEWGEPTDGLSVDKQPVSVQGKSYNTVIGTHANSTLRFNLYKRFGSLTGKAALPDYLMNKKGASASVVFQISVDGVQVWESRRLTPKDQQQDFDLAIVGAGLLELRVLDGGDGIDNDHGVWVNLHLT